MANINEAWCGGMCGDGFTTFNERDFETHAKYLRNNKNSALFQYTEQLIEPVTEPVTEPSHIPDDIPSDIPMAVVVPLAKKSVFKRFFGKLRNILCCSGNPKNFFQDYVN